MMAILATYGFEPTPFSAKTLWWGVGTLVWGDTAEVKRVGKDLYEVKYHSWFYDSYGECLKDDRETVILHGALMLQYLVERLPLRSWSPNRRGY
jgi:hypothetical protein